MITCKDIHIPPRRAVPRAERNGCLANQWVLKHLLRPWEGRVSLHAGLKLFQAQGPNKLAKLLILRARGILSSTRSHPHSYCRLRDEVKSYCKQHNGCAAQGTSGTCWTVPGRCQYQTYVDKGFNYFMSVLQWFRHAQTRNSTPDFLA